MGLSNPQHLTATLQKTPRIAPERASVVSVSTKTPVFLRLMGCFVQHSSLTLFPHVYPVREVVFSFRFSPVQGEYKQDKNTCANSFDVAYFIAFLLI